MGTSLVSCGSRSVSTNIADTPIITVTITETEPVAIATEETEATSAETVTDTETVKSLNKETAPTVEETSEAVEVTSDEGYPVVDDSYVAYHFRSKKQLNEHFEKHGAEFDGDFDYQSAEDYEEGASDVINNDDALFKYENLKTGETVTVETLELLCNPEITTDDIDTYPQQTTIGSSAASKQEPKLSSKHIDVRENQMGISYKSLFGDYMRTAKKMTIIDPYVRAVFQIDNLVDLIRTFVESTKENEGLQIELHTNETDEKLPALIDNLDQIKDDLARYNIEFSYAFDADHDRCIKLDNGWRMLLSRGIDIFEKFDRFSLSNQRQELRRCRAFSVTYLEE